MSHLLAVFAAHFAVPGLLMTQSAANSGLDCGKALCFRQGHEANDTQAHCQNEGSLRPSLLVWEAPSLWGFRRSWFKGREAPGRPSRTDGMREQRVGKGSWLEATNPEHARGPTQAFISKP